MRRFRWRHHAPCDLPRRPPLAWMSVNPDLLPLEYSGEMCRSIKVLRRPDERATSEELNAAALQFVRKISGFHKPSQANTEVFNRAVSEIAAASQRLLDGITPGRTSP